MFTGLSLSNWLLTNVVFSAKYIVYFLRGKLGWVWKSNKAYVLHCCIIGVWFVTESLSTKPSTYTDPKTFQTNRLCQEKNSLWCNFGDTTLCFVSGQLTSFLKHAVGHQRNKKCLFLVFETTFDFQVSIGSTKKHLAFIVGAVSCFFAISTTRCHLR